MQLRIIAVFSPLFLSACAADIPADIMPLPSPDNPRSGIVQVRPTNYFDGYVDRRPVDRRSWRERNEGLSSGSTQ